MPRLERMFAAAGWQVLEAKYGRRLREAFARPGGEALRARIDEHGERGVPGPHPQAGDEARSRLLEGSARATGRPSRGCSPTCPTTACRRCCRPRRPRLRRARRASATPPTMTGSANGRLRLHDQGLAAAVRRRRPEPLRAAVRRSRSTRWRRDLGVDPRHPWAGVRRRLARGAAVRERGALLRAGRRARVATRQPVRAPPPRASTCGSQTGTSTQQAFGDALAALARDPRVAARLVTASPDVSVSTSLGGWINRVGVFAPGQAPVVDDTPRPLHLGAQARRPARRARHQRDEPVPVAQPVRAHGRAVRRAARPDRDGLRPVHLPRARRPHLRPLRPGPLHPGGDAVRDQPGARGRRPPVDDHAVDRDRAARAARLRAGVRPGGRLVPLEGSGRCLDRAARLQHVPAPLDPAGRPVARASPSARAWATKNCGVRSSRRLSAARARELDPELPTGRRR